MVFRSNIFASLIGAAAVFVFGSSARAELCSLVPGTYATAKLDYPEVAFAIEQVEKQSIATWYSDREANGDYKEIAKKLVETCPQSSTLSVVVYGMPHKDCEAGYSTSGSRVQSAEDYIKFLQVLIDTVKDRKVLYVLEPDAVGLLAKDGGCGEVAGYRNNLKTAIQMLSVNTNAEIYLDVGYWTLAYTEPRQRVVEVITDLVSGGGRVKGITLNTSNYRSTTEIAGLCRDFQATLGMPMNCIVDTSRNYNGAPSTEWCNVAAAGIGRPPTEFTGLDNIDYYLWIKPPGESDGQCDGSSHTADAMRGPAPGTFFLDAFKKLWDQGYFVDALHMPKTDGSSVPGQTMAPPATTTPAPEPSATQSATPEPTEVETTPTPVPSMSVEPPPAPETPAPTEPVTTTPTTTAPTMPTTPTEPTPTMPTEPMPTMPTTPATTTPTTTMPTTRTSAPVSTTVTPVGGATTTPTVTPLVTAAPGTSTMSPSVKPTKRPQPTTTHKPKPTKRPRTHKPTVGPTTPTPTAEAVAATPTPTPTIRSGQDGGPITIGHGPTSSTTANTNSGEANTGSSGGIIAALLVAAVALAVGAAVFIHVRRRAKDAASDAIKTPATMDPAHPLYLSQL